MNRLRRHIATVLLMTGMALHLAAQSYVTPLTQDFVPPSPQSWTPVERQLPRPALMTGAAEFSIPIYTVQVGDYSLPISLQYHSNGVKVLDDPCPLGYGWTLQPALRATRTILGRPDEHYPFYDNLWNIQEPALAAFQCMVASYINTEYWNEKYDSQHDIFTIALPDATITRVLKYDFENKVAKFYGIREADYRVKSTGKLDELTVTGPDGVEYVFGAPYECIVSREYQLGELRTAWALKKIVLGSREEIKFEWMSTRTTSRSILAGKTYMSEPPVGSELHDTAESDNVADAMFTQTGSTYESFYLRKIIFPGGSVDFSYYDGNVSKIDVLSGTAVVKSAKLEYIYDTKLTTRHIPYLLAKVMLSDEGTYCMDYCTPGYWSTQELYSQDWWGYYNGIENEMSNGLQPAIHLIGYKGTNDKVCPDGADRRVRTEAMKRNILTRIIYPTGGYSQLEYEAHSFPPMRNESGNGKIAEEDNPYLSEGGGLRVKKIVSGSSPDDSEPCVTSYDYSEPQIRAVPSAATFLSYHQGALLNYALGGGIVYADVVNVGPFSNYMKDDLGIIPIWYKYVNESYKEGGIKYEFGMSFNHTNRITRDFGKQYHRDILNACGLGPVLRRRTVYKQMVGHTRVVEEEEWSYAPVVDTPLDAQNVSLTSVDILRSMIQINSNSITGPDFTYGKEMPSGYNHAYLSIEQNPYDMLTYSIIPFRDNLTAHTRTVYGEDGGAYTVTTEYTYLNQSALVSTVKTRGSRGETKLTTINYPQAERSWVEGQMVSRGMTGVPIKETVNEGGAVTVYEMEYGRTGGWTLIPVQMRTRFGASADALEGPRFSHNSWGRPTGWTDADGISELWLWGHFGRYPVWNVPGETYLSVYNNKKIRVDTQRADTIPAGKVREKFPLATEYRFKPLVGLSAVVTPAGTGSYYSYDAAGRLDSVRLNDRLLTSYKYNISQTGDNYVWASHEISTPRVEGEFYSFSHDIKTTYDGLGRPVETRDYSTGIRSLREYDAMGRLWRESVASRNAPGEYDWTLYGYETSPRGVLTSTTKPGEAWHKGGKAATVRILTNKTSGEYSLATYSFTGGSITRTGNYPASSLLIEECTDEDGHVVRKFTDKSGRTVATSEGVSGQMLTTRYIYGDYGRLRYVLPPDIPDGTVSAATLAEKAYSYSYDSRGRLTESRVPGCAPARTRYSRAGRVVAEHPSAMAEGKWLLHFYDKFGREILTTIASPTEAQLQSLCDTLRTASYFGYNLHGGYKFDRSLPCEFGEIQKAIYYDDYKFATRTDADYGFDTPPAVTAGEAPGFVTGECDYSEGASAGRGTLYSYDGRGFVVEKWAMLPVGRQHTVYTYDDFGRVITETETLCQGTRPLIERETVNGYDSAGRLIRLSVTENGVTARMSYGYNELGLLSKTVRGLDIQHLQEYDVHGWPTRSTISIPKALPVVPGTFQPLSLSDTYYSGLIVNPGGDVVAPEFQLPRKEYSEELFYAEGGAIPRFTGCPSARVTTLGGRYDYHFDVHDRLTRADYTPRNADSGEDFSAEYSYGVMANPLKVKRWGVIDRSDDGERTFGLMDELSYEYDEARRPVRISSSGEGSDFYGRTGFPLSDAEITWTASGHLYSDSARGIESSTYNHRGQLLTQRIVGNGSVLLSNRYDADGRLIRRGYSRITPQGSYTSGVRVYSANRIFYKGKLEYSYFPGGYFDADGKVHYTFTDYQGSVIMVTDSVGKVEQHMGYYPYGTPWSTPSGQRRLHIGKELVDETANYVYEPRNYYSAALLWDSNDAHASDNPGFSPYTYCGANPVSRIDVNGKDIVVLYSNLGVPHLGALITNGDGRLAFYSKNGTDKDYVSSRSVGLFESSGSDASHKVARGEESWASLDDFAASAEGKEYSKYISYSTTPEQDNAAAEAMTAELDKPYNLVSANCSQAVVAGLNAGMEKGSDAKTDGAKSKAFGVLNAVSVHPKATFKMLKLLDKTGALSAKAQGEFDGKGHIIDNIIEISKGIIPFPGSVFAKSL